ncbi:MAG: hypothetical protein PHC78_05495 [Verrucomicrobiota bacterium]|nr:hypothetical protein [Verrucomicrobiota bacterium]
MPVLKWEREAKCRKKRLLFRFCLSPTQLVLVLVLVLVLSLVSMPLSGGYAADEFPELETFREMEARRRAFFDDIKVHLHREESLLHEKFRILLDDSVIPPVSMESNIQIFEEEIWFKGENIMNRSTGPWTSCGSAPDEAVIYKNSERNDVFNFDLGFSKSFHSEAIAGRKPIGYVYHDKKQVVFKSKLFCPIRLATGRSLEVFFFSEFPIDIITRENLTYFEETPCALYRFVRLGEEPSKTFRYELFVIEESSYIPIGFKLYYGPKYSFAVSLFYDSWEGETPIPTGWELQQFIDGEFFASSKVKIEKIDFAANLTSSEFDIEFPPLTSFQDEFPDGRVEHAVVLANGKIRKVTNAELERLLVSGNKDWEEVYKTPTGMAGLIKSEHLKIAKLFAIGIGLALALLVVGKWRKKR